MKQVVLLLSLWMVVFYSALSEAGGPPKSNSGGVYKMILSEADANRDGRLSVKECMTIYKDQRMAKKNCAYWDADHDGMITEDEYSKQALKTGIKKF